MPLIPLDGKIIEVSDEKFEQLRKQVGIHILLPNELLNEEERLIQLYLSKTMEGYALGDLIKIKKYLPYNSWLKSYIDALMVVLYKSTDLSDEERLEMFIDAVKKFQE